MDSNERLNWIAWNMVHGIGAVRLRVLLDSFGSAQKAFQATPSQLRELGLGETIIDHFLEVKNTIDFSSIDSDLQKFGVKALTWEDEEYPHRLKDLEQAPPVLYIRGELLPEDEWAVALVGTRRFTSYGRQVAEELGTFLAHNGITVIS